MRRRYRITAGVSVIRVRPACALGRLVSECGRDAAFAGRGA